MWRLLWSLCHADEAAWKLVPSMGAVNCVAMSPTSNEFAWGGADGSVNIVDSNGRRRQLRPLDSSVVRLAYSIDARWIAAAGDNGDIRLWKAESWQEVGELHGHKGLIREMLFHPDGTHLTSVDDQGFRIWDLNDIGAVRVLDHPEPNEDMEITVSADASTAATYGGLNNTVQIWRLRKGDLEPETLPPQRAIILSSVLSSNGSTAYISTHDSGLSRWDVETLRRTVTFSQDVLAPSLALSVDGQILVSTGEDNLIRIWEAESGRQLQTVRGHPGSPSDVAIGADSAALAAVSGDGRLRVRSIQTEDRDDVLLHKGIVVCLAVSPNGQTLATADPNHQVVNLWDMPDGELIGSIKGKHNVAFSPDRKWLAVMSFEGQLQLWDRSTPLNRLQTIGDLGSNPVTFGRNLTFSHGSKMLAFSGKNGTVIIWDVDKREVIHSLPDHSKDRPVAFGPHDKVIATASSQLVRIWNVRSGRLLAPPIRVRHGSRDRRKPASKTRCDHRPRRRCRRRPHSGPLPTSQRPPDDPHLRRPAASSTARPHGEQCPRRRHRQGLSLAGATRIRPVRQPRRIGGGQRRRPLVRRSDSAAHVALARDRRAIVDGNEPKGLTLAKLRKKLPLIWAEQKWD